MRTVIHIGDEKRWLENQFKLAHGICSILHGRPIASFLGFADAIAKNEKAAIFIDRLIRECIPYDVLPLYQGKQQFVESVMLSVYKLYQWGANGFGVFDVCPGLLQQLRITDPSSAPIVPMPFDTFVMRFQRGSCEVFGHDIRAVWVHRYAWKDTESTVMIEAMGDDTFERPIAFQAPWADLFKLNVALVEEHYGGLTAELRTIGASTAEVGAAKTCAALAANLCFYILSESGAKEAASKPPRPGLKKIPGKSWPRCWALGKDVSIDPRLVDALKNDGQSVERAKLKFKHIVRGHWRNQACGPQHSTRRVVWIKPYWKGPDVDEAWSHQYKV